MLTPTIALPWAAKWRGKSSEDEYFFIIMRRNYKRTRSHERSMYKYSLHVNNREIDQEKQNKTVARWKVIATETWSRFSLLI